MQACALRCVSSLPQLPTKITCQEEAQHQQAAVFGQGPKALHANQRHAAVNVGKGRCMGERRMWKYSVV